MLYYWLRINLGIASFYQADSAAVIPPAFAETAANIRAFDDNPAWHAGKATNIEMYCLELETIFKKVSSKQAPLDWLNDCYEDLGKVEDRIIKQWKDRFLEEFSIFLVRMKMCRKFWKRARDAKFRAELEEPIREAARYMLINAKALKIDLFKFREGLLSLAESGSWTDPRQLFARLGGRVLGFQACSQRVLTAEGIEDLVLEVRGEPAAMLNIYVFSVIYQETTGHEAITLEFRLSPRAQMMVVRCAEKTAEPSYGLFHTMASIIFDPRRHGMPEETGEGNHLNRLTREALVAKLIGVVDEAHLDVGHLYMYTDAEQQAAIDSTPSKFVYDAAAKMVTLARQKSSPFPLSALVSRFIYEPLKGPARREAREWIEKDRPGG